MKKTLLIALLAAASAPFAAQAQSYVGVNVGRSEQKLSSDGAGSESDNATGFRLSLGSAFTPNFGIEAGFVKQGSIEVDVGGGNIAYSKPKTFYIGGTGTYAVSPVVALTAKLGVAWNRTDFGYSGTSMMHRETAALVGVGATYAFTPAIMAVAEYENYGRIFDQNGTKIEGSMLSLGLRFNY